MAKNQRQYRRGALYSVVGSAKLKRKLLFVGRMTIDGQQLLIFREQRKVVKRRARYQAARKQRS